MHLLPHHEFHQNPIAGAPFDAFEIHAVAEYPAIGSERNHVEQVMEENHDDEECLRAYYSIYGHYRIEIARTKGALSHLLDCATLRDAHEFLIDMGIMSPATTHEPELPSK